jgi:hypothetical protein
MKRVDKGNEVINMQEFIRNTRLNRGVSIGIEDTEMYIFKYDNILKEYAVLSLDNFYHHRVYLDEGEFERYIIISELKFYHFENLEDFYNNIKRVSMEVK